jgi:diguanylate cyclase (GGDEF)-like protein
MAIFDIDHFKRINDTFGHSIGDFILKTIAEIIKKNIRTTTYLFRWGGEEFVILIPEIDLEGAKIHAERLRRAIEEHVFGEAGAITASFGVSQFEDGDSADTFLKKADAALYKAKSNGRNRVEISDSVA